MSVFYLSLTLIWLTSFGCIATTLSAPRRKSYPAALGKRDIEFSNSTSLDTSWSGVTLFHYSPETDHGNVAVSASINVICTTCYIKGNITATLTTDGDFNISQAIRNITSDIEEDFKNITETTIDFIKDNLTISALAHDVENLEFPPIPVDFDIKLPDIPEVTLQLQFDGMELYMQTETTFSADATYSLNLFTSKIDFVGAGFDKDGVEGFAGLVFTVDLILSVDASISISSGFHITLDDGLGIGISVFGQNISHLTLGGGKFEFLPVSIESAGVVLRATLRVGAKLGFDLSIDADINDLPDVDFSGGVEGVIFADVAQFVTNVTAGDGSGCDFEVVEEYTFLLGANAGATVALDAHTWGPSPSTQTAIFFTTLLDVCAISGSATIPSSNALITATSSPGLLRRADASLTTTTLSTTVTNTATVCLQAGLVNCPVSLQSTPQNTATLTTVLTVSSGASPTFPPITQNVVSSTIPFGTNVKDIDATSGSPTSFIPKATGITSTVSSEVKNHRTLVFGLAIGIGVPLFVAVVAGCFYCCKSKRSKPAKNIQYAGSYTSSFGKKSPIVTVGTPGSLGGQSPNPAGRDHYFQSRN